MHNLWSPFSWVVGAWLWFAFLAISSYSGNLMAFLVKPDYPPPMETIDDIFSSGLPWKMVVYNDTFEYFIKLSYPELWEGKEIAPYDDFPFSKVTYFPKGTKKLPDIQDGTMILQLQEVFNEESLFIDYRALLDIAVLAAFGKSQGLEELPLHLARGIFPMQDDNFLVRHTVHT